MLDLTGTQPLKHGHGAAAVGRHVHRHVVSRHPAAEAQHRLRVRAGVDLRLPSQELEEQLRVGRGVGRDAEIGAKGARVERGVRGLGTGRIAPQPSPGRF